MKERSISNSWSNLVKHMEEKHKNSQYFGDSVRFSQDGISEQVCQLCGEEISKSTDSSESAA